VVPHPELQEVPILCAPLVMDGKRLPVRLSGPLLGEHTEQVMREMCGLTVEEHAAQLVEEVI
jgi:crotonobetainyl-CoA:carnitine CoA-transferase CaiB-like acyl-CoA transferase